MCVLTYAHCLRARPPTAPPAQTKTCRPPGHDLEGRDRRANERNTLPCLPPVSDSSAAASPRPPRCRLLAALTACGYGSEAKDDDSGAKVAAGGKKIDGLDSVKIGYFAEPDPRHRAGRCDQEGLLPEGAGRHQGQVPDLQRRSRPRSRRSTSGSIDIGWIGPSPAINGYTKSKGTEPAHHRRFGVRRCEARRQPEEDQVPRRTSRARRSPPRSSATPRTWRSSTGSPSRAGRSTRRAARATSRSSAPTTR